MKRIGLTAAVLIWAFLLTGAAAGDKGTGQSFTPALPISSPPVADQFATGLLERTAGGHIIGFGAREIIFGSSDHALRLELVDSRPVAPESAGAEGAGVKGQASVLDTVTYKEPWPGVNLTYHGNGSGVAKSVWTVAPGAPLESIRVRANAPVQIDKSGNLTYSFHNGRMTESKPVAWQEIGGRRVPVDVAYRVDGEKEFGFTAAARDSRYALVIDPILSWNTFLGAGGDESANSIALDASGNTYIVGWSNATWGSPIRAYTANYDAFVAKLSPNGTRLWHTFLGGNMNDYGYGIGLDAIGNIYVSGQSNFTWGSPIRPFATSPDEFVAKLNSSGTLQWNTFLGGTGYDYNNGLAVDPGGNAYVVGASDASWGAPIRPHANPGSRDWSIAKVDNNGYLQWNTFLGGTSTDTAYGTALDIYGNIYVVGTSRTTWGTPLNPYSGGSDITVAKLNASSGVLVWHTFLGQAGADNAYGIAFGGGDIVVIAGTSDATWGTPVNPYAGGNTDGLVVALQSDGTFLGHSFLGGAGDDGCVSVAITKAGQIYVGGYSTIAWGSPDQPFGGGGSDGFVIRLGATGSLQAHTFVGGSGIDSVNALALDANRNFFIVGTSETGWGAPIVAFSGLYDGFVMKSTFIPEALDRHAVGDFDGDTQDEAAVDFGTLGVWVYDGGGWSQNSPQDPESLVTMNIDGNGDDEIIADMGDGGLWLWDGGTWSQISVVDAEELAVGDVDGSGDEEIIADFGPTGLWLYDLGGWVQISAVNVDYVALADLDTVGGKEIIGDFGATGLWVDHAGTWYQLSGVNADFFTCGNTDGAGGQEIVGDFGITGMWLNNTSVWTQLSGVNVNYLITADTNADGKADIFGDFGPVGLWLWNNGAWTMLSGVREDFMVSANLDADPSLEVVVDFGPLGLWAYDNGAWTQLSGVNPDYVISGDFDGDAQAELMVDFAALGLWVYNGGAWTQVSNVNPD